MIEQVPEVGTALVSLPSSTHDRASSGCILAAFGRGVSAGQLHWAYASQLKMKLKTYQYSAPST